MRLGQRRKKKGERRRGGGKNEEEGEGGEYDTGGEDGAYKEREEERRQRMTGEERRVDKKRVEATRMSGRDERRESFVTRRSAESPRSREKIISNTTSSTLLTRYCFTLFNFYFPL